MVNYLKYYIIIILILFSAVFNSFRNAYHSHISFFEKKPNKIIQNGMSSISQNIMFNTFFKYTGLDTGYGFFSPNVASDFIIIHEVYKKEGKYNILSDTKLKSKEGALRFSNINAVFMQFLEMKQKEFVGKEKLTPEEELNIKYLQTILKRLSDERNVMEKSDSVITKVYLYNFPMLKQFPNIEPKIIEIEKVVSKKIK